MIWEGDNMGILSLLTGYKTYIAVAGLLGLALYQASTGQLDLALQSLLGGLAAAGLHADLNKPNS
jgi:hypothetical protein